MKQHHKHPPLARRHRGNFSHNEIAWLGAPCSVLEEAVVSLQQFFPKHHLAYFDAEHHPEESKSTPSLHWTDHQHKHITSSNQALNAWDFRSMSGSLDASIVNGNHFEALSQLVFIHPKKLESLSRKLDRLSNPMAIIFCEDETELPDFLPENMHSFPSFRLEDEAWMKWFGQQLLQPAPLKGLVLAGGKSQRMGEDKGLMDFHGMPQREHIHALLNEVSEEVFVSCRSDQEEAISAFGKPLIDRITDFGPYGAILSAFMHDPDAAWFVVACDMPGLDKEALSFLKNARLPQKVATSFCKNEEAFPEPLLSIWEPKAYPRMLAFMAQGNSCPRKVLINSDVERVLCPKPAWISNVNTPEEAKNWR